MALPPLHNHPAPYFESEAQLEVAAGNIAEQGWTLIPDFLQPSIVTGLRKAAAARRAAGGFRPTAIGRASGIANEGPERTFEIRPEAGLLVAFLSDRIPHEVLPTRRDRLSIASWFRGRPR